MSTSGEPKNIITNVNLGVIILIVVLFLSGIGFGCVLTKDPKRSLFEMPRKNGHRILMRFLIEEANRAEAGFDFGIP